MILIIVLPIPSLHIEMFMYYIPVVFNLLSSRANLHLSYNLRAAVISDYKIIIGAWAPPHSPTLTSLHLRHSSFSNPSAALPTSQLILQPFRCFIYVICTSPTSQVILQPFRCSTYVTGTSCTSPGEPPMHRGMKKQSVVD